MAASPILAILQIEENQNNKYITANTAIQLLEASQEDHYINAAVGAAAVALTEAQSTQYIYYELGGLTGNQNLVFRDLINGNSAKRKFLVSNTDSTDTLTVKAQSAGLTVAIPPGGKVWIVQKGVNMVAVSAIYSGTSPYDVGVFFPGTPTVTQLLARHVAARAFTLPGNFAGSVGHINANPTASFAIDVKVQSTTVGTITISTLGVFTFTTVAGAAVNVAIGERISFFGPSPVDATAADIAFTLIGNRAV